MSFNHGRVPVLYVLSFWAVSLLAFKWFFGTFRLRLCRLILLQQTCCDIGDEVFNRNSSGQLTQNKSTVWLFNSLCKLGEQQSCCQQLLKDKRLFKEKKQNLDPLVEKPSELHKASIDLNILKTKTKFNKYLKWIILDKNSGTNHMGKYIESLSF